MPDEKVDAKAPENAKPTEVKPAAGKAAEKAGVVEPEYDLTSIESARRAVAEGYMHEDLFEDRFKVKP